MGTEVSSCWDSLFSSAEGQSAEELEALKYNV